MKFYLAVVYLRRLKKGGYFGEEAAEKTNSNLGTAQDFTKLFGSEVKSDNG